MKPILTIAFTAGFCLYAMTVHAQDTGIDLQAHMEKLQSMPPKEREALLQNMQRSAEAMHQCVEKAGGQGSLEELQALSHAHRQQVAALCTAGKREQAQAYAQDASQELLKDPRVGKLRQCSRIALQNMPQLNQVVETGGIDPNKHVCD